MFEIRYSTARSTPHARERSDLASNARSLTQQTARENRCHRCCTTVKWGMAAHQYVYRDRVQFSDTDMAGIVHFSNFARYMERAEHAFFRSLGLSVWEDPSQFPDDDRVAWPRVHSSCDFHAPLRFQEEFGVELLVEEVRSKSVRYLFRCWKEGKVLAAEGRVAVACVRKDPESGRMQAVMIPDRIRKHLSAAPEDALKRPRPPGADG